MANNPILYADIGVSIMLELTINIFWTENYMERDISFIFQPLLDVLKCNSEIVTALSTMTKKNAFREKFITTLNYYI